MARVPNNKLLTNLACSSCAVECWPSVVSVQTSLHLVRTATTLCQYSPELCLRSVNKKSLILLWFVVKQLTTQSLWFVVVFDDLGEITRRHFKDLQTLVRQRRSQEIEQASLQYPAQYSTQQQGNQYNTQQPKQQTNYYQTGPVQQPPSAYQYQSGRMY